MATEKSYEERAFDGRNGSVYDGVSLLAFQERQQELLHQQFNNTGRRVGATPSAPPAPLLKAIRSGVFGGAIMAAIVSYFVFGAEQIAPIITWTIYGAVGGGALVLAFRILIFLLEIAFKIIGWGLLAFIVLYFFGVFDKM